jgi:hypothetical protein
VRNRALRGWLPSSQVTRPASSPPHEPLTASLFAAIRWRRLAAAIARRPVSFVVVSLVVQCGPQPILFYDSPVEVRVIE